ncbi:MAG TPA: hypothetical protein VEK06_01560 [Myxococcota bacterium]|nr:hypothetical protein [Myxococcota bacterium]
MSKIDKQMMNDFKTFSKKWSDEGKQISEDESKQLIRRAATLNGTYTSSCSGSSENKGTKDLKYLMRKYEDRFSPAGKAAINTFTSAGMVRNPPMGPSGMPGMNPAMGPSGMPGMNPAMGMGNPAVVVGGPSMPTGVRINPNATMMSGSPMPGNPIVSTGSMHPNSGRTRAPTGPRPQPTRVATSTGARPDIGTLRPSVGANPSGGIGANVAMNPSGGAMGANMALNPSVGTPVNNGANEANATMAINTPTPTPNAANTIAAANVGGPTGITTPYGKRILDFRSSNPTWECHWFPLKENRPGGDPTNNLYAKGGALQKLDMVTGKNSQGYEYAHHRKGIGEGAQFNWWGHCNHAAQVACIFQEPRHSVTVTGRDGRPVTFDTNDIQGLLVKASGCLIQKVDFRGQRFNSSTRDDPNEPYPDMFISVMQEWAQKGMPFVLDIDREGQVWNFPYDQVLIDESNQPPQGFNGNLPNDGSVKYYHIHMEGTGYPSKIRNYAAYIQRDASGAVTNKGWIKTPNTNNNPDFMWQPYGMPNIMDRSNWQLRGNEISNPEVDMQVIYDIYMQSLA